MRSSDFLAGFGVLYAGMEEKEDEEEEEVGAEELYLMSGLLF